MDIKELYQEIVLDHGKNPRNKNRHLPSGSLTVRYMSAISFFAALIFLFSAYMLNWLSFFLAPVALIYMLIYPFAKRFTWASNLMLGWVLAIAPSAAWIGVKGTLNVEPILLSCAVALWAASFDIIYHVQDFDFYRNYGFHSIAQKFGIRLSLIFARILDLVALVLLVLLGYLMELSFTYYIGIMISIGFLLYKHLIISAENLSRIGPSFFRINAYVSIYWTSRTSFFLRKRCRLSNTKKSNNWIYNRLLSCSTNYWKIFT